MAGVGKDGIEVWGLDEGWLVVVGNVVDEEDGRKVVVKSSKSWAWCEAWRWRCVREESRDMTGVLIGLAGFVGRRKTSFFDVDMKVAEDLHLSCDQDSGFRSTIIPVCGTQSVGRVAPKA